MTVFDRDESVGTPSSHPCASGIEDVRTFQLLVHGDMRVPEQDQTGIREIPGVQQRVERVFHTVAVSVRSEDPHAADRENRCVRIFRP